MKVGINQLTADVLRLIEGIENFTIKIKKKISFLCNMDISLDNYFKVYYNGEYWFANKSDVYEG